MKSVTTTMQHIWTRLRSHDPHPASHAEKLISTAGGFVGVLLVLIVSGRMLDFHGAALVVASTGASAVLLFATPHSALSQPWSVFGGHMISAFIGITCAKFLSNPVYAGALAVALSIAAMHYLRCLHPPGGATSLIAVIGGDPIRALDYGFMVTPVLVNVLIIMIVAVVANYPFHWRRYPFWISRPKHKQGEASCDTNPEKVMIAYSDLIDALSEIGHLIEVSEEDILQIYHLAVRNSLAQAKAGTA
ncbi:MAG TPA: HPP family protein [Gallionellaceae bacterium]|nr:HPP family protein [Gallionellaceae bacterium]